MSWLSFALLAIIMITKLDSYFPQDFTNKLQAISRPPHSRQQLLQPSPHTYKPSPVQTGSATIKLEAKSSIAMDTTTGQVLHSQNADQQLPVASITKIITALTLIGRHKPDDIITIPTLPKYQPNDELMGLEAGQRFRFEDLLASMLVQSGNDAADALAIADSGSITKFAARMNTTASRFGISNTHFVAPSGLLDTQNYATARTLSQFAQLVLANERLAKMVATPALTVSDVSGQSFDLINTNQLLNDNRFYGIKTGYTEAAGQSLVAASNINGHSVITVVLNSPDRFGETASLVNYLERNFAWQ